MRDHRAAFPRASGNGEEQHREMIRHVLVGKTGREICAADPCTSGQVAGFA